ncbi:hypothetical protein D3C76_1654140 [compost metagenome]
MIATYLLSRYNGDWQPVALYLLGTVTISLIAVLAVRSPKRDDQDPALRGAVKSA